MNVFELAAKLTLDSSEFDAGLSKAKGMASTLGSGIGTAMKVGAAAVGVATAAVGAFAKSSVDAGSQFDSSMSQVAATMGKTMSEMQNEVGSTTVTLNGQVQEFSGNLREFAQFMGQNTAFSATEAADALNFMALAGYDAQTSMNMLPNVLNLAAAGNMDLATASDMVTDTQTAFGISLERTSQMVDEMAKASSTGNTSVQQLGEAFLTVGGLAQELNGGMVKMKDGTTQSVDGVQELEIALTAMANAGVKGSEAGTHMRNMLLKLSSPTKEGVEQLENLGVAVFDAEGNMRSLSDIFTDLNGSLGNLTQKQKIEAISDLFNTRDLASAEALLNAVGQDWDAIGESILNADGAAAQMASTQLDNLAGDITLFKSALEGAQIAVSDVLMPSLREFVQFGTEGLSRLTTAFKEGGLNGAMAEFGTILSEGLNMVISEVPSFIDAGIQLIGALGQGLIDNAPAIFSALTTVAGQLATAIMDMMTTAAQGLSNFNWSEAATSIATGLTNVFTGEGMQNFIQTGVQILTGIITGISESIPILIPAAMNIISSLGNMLAEQAPTLIQSGVQLIRGLVEGFTNPDGLTGMLQAAINIITSLQQGMLQGIPQVLTIIPTLVDNLLTAIVQMAPVLIQGALELVTNIITELPNIIQGIIDIIPTLMQSIITAVLSALPMIMTLAPQIIGALVPALIAAAPQLLTVGPQLMLALGQGIISSIPTLIATVVQLIQTVITTIMDSLTKFMTLGQQLLQKFIEGIKSKFGELQSTAKRIPEIVKEAIQKVIEKAKEWGADLMKNFIGGIKSKFDALKEAASGLGNTIKGVMGHSHPTEGPMKDDYLWMPDMMELFAKGIRDNEHLVTDQLKKSFDVRDLITEPFTGASVAESNRANTNEIVNLLTQIRDRGNVVVIEGDASRMFRVMQSESRKYQQTTGKEAFVW